MRPLRGSLLVLAAWGWWSLQAAAPVTLQGERLAAAYSALDVAHHWLPGQQVEWRTGEPRPGRPGRTHCSAFAAAACDRLGIYLLRPPEHPQTNLANAQAVWLAQEGPAQGWRPVPSPLAAQVLANQGQVVLAIYASPDPGRAGHVALVRPLDKPDDRVLAEGPQVVQAGAENAASVSLAVGFRHHRSAWIPDGGGGVAFYAHGLADAGP